MKRETKVGMTVAGVFLAMAGGALGIRMWKGQPETPSAPTTNEVAQQSPPSEANTTVPPPNAVVNTAAPTIPPVVATPTSLTQPPPTTTVEPQINFPPPAAVVPAPVSPAMVVPDVKSPEPTFPPVVETPKQADVQPPPPITNDSPKPVDPTPVTPVVEPKKDEPAPPPAFPPVVETKTDVPIMPPPVTPQVPVSPEPVAKIETPQRPEGGSPAPLPDAIKSVQPTGVNKPTRPATDSYMEEEYKLRAGDSYNAVSKKFYYHEKYSQALQQYNRDYPLASANLKADPPRMNAGLVVWIPPIRILERRYPNLIPDFKPVPGQTTSASPTATADAPTWTPANNNPAAQPVSTNSSAMKTYRVRDGGETMHEIARRTLGNTLAWQDIYRLNPSLNPSATTPIPAGTLLRLPATAKE